MDLEQLEGLERVGAQLCYVVEDGDNPSHIARDLIGDASRWRELIKANPQKATKSDGSFKYLNKGEVLNVPSNWWPAIAKLHPGVVTPATPATPTTPATPAGYPAVIPSGNGDGMVPTIPIVDNGSGGYVTIGGDGKPTPATPPPATPATPPPAPDSGLPFGLTTTHLLIGGGVLVAGILLMSGKKS